MKMLNNQRGQGMVEYALIVVLIAIAAIAVLTAFREQIAAVFGNISAQFGGAK